MKYRKSISERLPQVSSSLDIDEDEGPQQAPMVLTTIPLGRVLSKNSLLNSTDDAETPSKSQWEGNSEYEGSYLSRGSLFASGTNNGSGGYVSDSDGYSFYAGSNGSSAGLFYSSDSEGPSTPSTSESDWEKYNRKRNPEAFILFLMLLASLFLIVLIAHLRTQKTPGFFSWGTTPIPPPPPPPSRFERLTRNFWFPHIPKCFARFYKCMVYSIKDSETIEKPKTFWNW